MATPRSLVTCHTKERNWVGLVTFCLKFKSENMLRMLVVVCFILATCGAQEHLTCLRTDNLITPSPPPTNENIQQGRPGRRGPPGPIGLKGEPGICKKSLIEDNNGNRITLFDCYAYDGFRVLKNCVTCVESQEKSQLCFVTVLTNIC